LGIFLSSVFGSASLGVFSLLTDHLFIVPSLAPETRMEKLGEQLKVEIVFTTVGYSLLVGALACGNSKGLIFPHFVREEELQPVRAATCKDDVKITVMETKRTAFGNTVLSNDFGAIVDPRVNPETLRLISDTLGVEAVRGEVAGLPYVGSLAAATNKGVLAHPLIKEEEKELLESVLRVPVEVGTVNCGLPYVKTGLLGNSYGAVAGLLTTGPELFIIESALDLVEQT
jgi:translation initiation factor 6